MSVLVWNLNMSWQQGYAPPNSDRREGVLTRKRLEYLECVSQCYDIPDTERSDDEINMLRQVIYSAGCMPMSTISTVSTNVRKRYINWLYAISYALLYVLLLRLLLIVLGLYLMSHSFSKGKFRNPWNASFIHG